MVTIYVEGGGNSRLARECGQAFSQFIRRSGAPSTSFRVIASGSRGDARRDFERALGQSENAMLLVDAEGPVSANNPWEHLRHSDSWTRPTGAQTDDCHLMVQVMESWFLADKGSVESFYGRDFRLSALPSEKNVELVASNEVLEAFRSATRRTGKGAYHKARHAFKILALVDPVAVRDASPWARRFLDTLAIKAADKA